MMKICVSALTMFPASYCKEDSTDNSFFCLVMPDEEEKTACFENNNLCRRI